MKKTILVVLAALAALFSCSAFASAYQAVMIRGVGLYSCDGYRLVSVYSSESAFEAYLAGAKQACFIAEQGVYDADCLRALQSVKSSAKRSDYCLPDGSCGSLRVLERKVDKGTVVYLESLKLENAGSEPITSLSLNFVLKSGDKTQKFAVDLSNEVLGEYLKKEPSFKPDEQAKEEIARTKIVCIDGTQKPLSKGSYFELAFTNAGKKIVKYFDSAGRTVSEYRDGALVKKGEKGEDFRALCKKLGAWSDAMQAKKKPVVKLPGTPKEPAEPKLLFAWEPGEIITVPVFKDWRSREKSHVVASSNVELRVSGSAPIVPERFSVSLNPLEDSMITRESALVSSKPLGATSLELLPLNRVALNDGWSLLYKDFYSLETEGGDGSLETRFFNLFQVFDDKDKLVTEFKREDSLRERDGKRVGKASKFSRKIERSDKKFFLEIPEIPKFEGVDSCGATDASVFSVKRRQYEGFGSRALFLGDSVKLQTSEGNWVVKVTDLASSGVVIEARLNNEKTPSISKRLVKDGGAKQQEISFEIGKKVIEVIGVFHDVESVRGLLQNLKYAVITLNPKKSLAPTEEESEAEAPNGRGG